MYTVCCDMIISSRLDAYVTNVNLIQGKKADTYIIVRLVFAIKIVLDKNVIPHQVEKLLVKSFPEQTGVVNFDKENLILNKKIINYFIIINFKKE